MYQNRGMNEEQKGGKWTEEGWRRKVEPGVYTIQWRSSMNCRKRKDCKKMGQPQTTYTNKWKDFKKLGHLQLSECWRLLYWATRDKGRHRGGWTQTDHPHCQLQKEADRPSSRTSKHPEPTNPLMGRTPTPAGSGNKDARMRVQMMSNAPIFTYCSPKILAFEMETDAYAVRTAT